jgi:hypothetical protein
MNITVCGRSVGIGIALGAAVLGSVWYGTTLAGRAAITQALLASARCDAAGFVSITFADASQFTCVPAQQIPPASRKEAARRQRSGS